MGAATIVTLVGVGLIVAALAAYLTIIAYTLRDVSFTLGTILIGVRAIEHQTQPLAAVVGDIADDVGGIDDALKGLLSGRRRALTRSRARR